MSTTTAVNLAHTIARMTDVPVETIVDLSVRELSVLYYGITSDDAPAHFRSSVDYLETPALELYALRAHLAPAEVAYCRLVLARREIRAGLR